MTPFLAQAASGRCSTMGGIIIIWWNARLFYTTNVFVFCAWFAHRRAIVARGRGAGALLGDWRAADDLGLTRLLDMHAPAVR